jgi:hypothetical protein
MFPPLALVLVLIPLFRLTEISLVVWPFVLLVDLVAIGLAVISASLLPVLVVLLLTLAATGALIFKIPVTLDGFSTLLFLLGAFAFFFVAAGVWLARRFKPDALRFQLGGNLSLPANLAVQLPALAAVLLSVAHHGHAAPAADRSFADLRPGVAAGDLLLDNETVSIDWMPAVGLAYVAALESTWHFNRFNPADPTRRCLVIIFLAVFRFIRSCSSFRDRVVPWAAAAMAGPAQFSCCIGWSRRPFRTNSWACCRGFRHSAAAEPGPDLEEYPKVRRG